jgi:hypothetical protein
MKDGGRCGRERKDASVSACNRCLSRLVNWYKSATETLVCPMSSQCPMVTVAVDDLDVC